jgi:hypothetical protein
VSGYDHRQVCPLTVLVLLAGVGCGLGALALTFWTGRSEVFSLAALGYAGFLFAVAFAGAFFHMRVRDRGDSLALEYGPLPLVHHELPYEAIESAEPTVIAQLQVWQVRQGRPMRVYGVRRGPAVQVNLKMLPGERLARALVIGTDEPERLLAFLRARLGSTEEGG